MCLENSHNFDGIIYKYTFYKHDFIRNGKWFDILSKVIIMNAWISLNWEWHSYKTLIMKSISIAMENCSFKTITTTNESMSHFRSLAVLAFFAHVADGNELSFNDVNNSCFAQVIHYHFGLKWSTWNIHTRKNFTNDKKKYK